MSPFRVAIQRSDIGISRFDSNLNENTSLLSDATNDGFALRLVEAIIIPCKGNFFLNDRENHKTLVFVF